MSEVTTITISRDEVVALILEKKGLEKLENTSINSVKLSHKGIKIELEKLNFLDGKISEFKSYDVALTNDEKEKNYVERPNIDDKCL